MINFLNDYFLLHFENETFPFLEQLKFEIQITYISLFTSVAAIYLNLMEEIFFLHLVTLLGGFRLM